MQGEKGRYLERVLALDFVAAGPVRHPIAISRL